MCSPNQLKQRFDGHNCQVFRGLEHWHPILIAEPEEKLRAYSDRAVRKLLRDDLAKADNNNAMFSQRWDLMTIVEPKTRANADLKGRNVAEVSAQRGTDPLDTFLDLMVEESLDMVFVLAEINVDPQAVSEILSSPYTVVGLSLTSSFLTGLITLMNPVLPGAGSLGRLKSQSNHIFMYVTIFIVYL